MNAVRWLSDAIRVYMSTCRHTIKCMCIFKILGSLSNQHIIHTYVLIEMIDLVVQCIATSVYTYYIMTLFVYIVRTSSSVGATPKGYGSCSTSPSLITELDNDLMAYKFTHSHIYGLQSVQYNYYITCKSYIATVKYNWPKIVAMIT